MSNGIKNTLKDLGQQLVHQGTELFEAGQKVLASEAVSVGEKPAVEVFEKKSEELKGLFHEKLAKGFSSIPQQGYLKFAEKAQGLVSELSQLRGRAEDIVALVRQDPTYLSKLQELDVCVQGIESLRNQFNLNVPVSRLEYLRLKGDLNRLKEIPGSFAGVQETNFWYTKLVNEAQGMQRRDAKVLNADEANRYLKQPQKLLEKNLGARRREESAMQMDHERRQSWSYALGKVWKKTVHTAEMLPLVGIGLGVAASLIRGQRSLGMILKTASVWGFSELGLRGAVQTVEGGYQETKEALFDTSKTQPERLAGAVLEGLLASAKATVQLTAGRLAAAEGLMSLGFAVLVKTLGEAGTKSAEISLNRWEMTNEIQLEVSPFQLWTLAQGTYENTIEALALRAMFKGATGNAPQALPASAPAALGAGEAGAALMVSGERSIALREVESKALAPFKRLLQDLIGVGSDLQTESPKSEQDKISEAFRYEILGTLTQVQGSDNQGPLVWHNKEVKLTLPEGLEELGAEGHWIVVANGGNQLKVAHPSYGEYVFETKDVLFNTKQPEKLEELKNLQVGNRIELVIPIGGASEEEAGFNIPEVAKALLSQIAGAEKQLKCYLAYEHRDSLLALGKEMLKIASSWQERDPSQTKILLKYLNLILPHLSQEQEIDLIHSSMSLAREATEDFKYEDQLKVIQLLLRGKDKSFIKNLPAEDLFRCLHQFTQKLVDDNIAFNSNLFISLGMLSDLSKDFPAQSGEVFLNILMHFSSEEFLPFLEDIFSCYNAREQDQIAEMIANILKETHESASGLFLDCVTLMHLCLGRDAYKSQPFRAVFLEVLVHKLKDKINEGDVLDIGKRLAVMWNGATPLAKIYIADAIHDLVGLHHFQAEDFEILIRLLLKRTEKGYPNYVQPLLKALLRHPNYYGLETTRELKKALENLKEEYPEIVQALKE